jgi:hypothetical protein
MLVRLIADLEILMTSRCGGENHMARDCNMGGRALATPRPPTVGPDEKQCYRCQGYGHIAKSVSCPCTKEVVVDRGWVLNMGLS